MPRQARKKSESGKVLENVIGKRHRIVPCPHRQDRELFSVLFIFFCRNTSIIVDILI